MDRRQAVKIIRNSALADCADRLEEVLEPSIRLRAQRVEEDSIPLGASRMGGRPDLPPGANWPRWMGSQIERIAPGGKPVHSPPKETPLDFLAQIRMDDVADLAPPGLLPRTGTLAFFYDFEHQPWGFDPNDRGGAKVLYFDEPADALTRTDSPRSDAGDFAGRPCLLSFEPCWTLPDWFQFAEEGDEFGDEYDELVAALAGDGTEEESLHRLLGHAQAIQGDMRLECQLVTNGLYCGNPEGYDDPRARTLEPGAAEWMLLLQVDSDEEHLGWMWGDCGRLYYWIRREDLRQHDFDAAWLVQQCY